MSFATSDRTGLWYIPEVTWGVTPGTGNLTELRYTGESLNANVETQVSEEIRSDRGTSDLTQVGQSAGGGIDLELSILSFDDFIASALFSTFSADLGIAAVTVDVSVDNAGSKFTSTVLTKWDTVINGQWIEVRGFVGNTGANNGFYQVTAAPTGDGDLFVTPAPPFTETSTGVETFSGSVIKNGVTPKSFTLEKRFNDATPITYQEFTGSIVAGMKLDFDLGSLLKGSFDFVSKDGVFSTTALAGVTPVAASTTDVVNSVTDLTNILIDGAVTTKEFLKLGMEIGNNLRGQKAIGSLAAVGIGAGSLDLTGPIEVYFENKAEFDLFDAGTSFSLSFLLKDTAGNGYMMTFPKVKYESLVVNSEGKNNDLVAKGTWRGLVDPTTSAMIQIDKFLA